MELYLGIDASTQGVKCLVIDAARGAVAAESEVNFGRDLPRYAAPFGFLHNDDPLIKHADPLMWLDGLELALERLAKTGVPMDRVKGLSGSGQQHGTVYLTAPVGPLGTHERLATQIGPLLSRKTSPIWMDRSTEAECRELTAAFGARLQRDTGSPAIERFSGPQIRRFAKDEPEAYRNTGRVHLVSSFLCSLLCGADAPIDYGDGAGMNLLNLRTLAWDDAIAAFTAPELAGKLPAPAASTTEAGRLDAYFARFGLTPDIPVTAWTGDNPSSLIGIGAGGAGVAGISLGTSDTFFAPMREFNTDPDGYGHVFGNPAGGFMSLICFTNGSLARERIKDAHGLDWSAFGKDALAATPPGAAGRLLLPYYEPESTPLVLAPGVKRNYADATPMEEVRALLESQALSLRHHSAWQGERATRLRLTGGASRAEGFLQIIADVFQAEVETLVTSQAAGVGAALRAARTSGRFSWEELNARFCAPAATITPRTALRSLYDAKLEDFIRFEREVL